MGPLARVPLRFKLTLAFTGVMAVLLAVAGIALSLLVAQNLDSTIDDGLAARAGDAAAVLRRAHRGRGGSRAPASRSRRCSLPDGRVLDTTTGAGQRSLLDQRSIEQALEGDVIVETPDARTAPRCGCSAGRVIADGRAAVVVVGEPLAQRKRALDALHALLAIGGPLALLFASGVGYAIAAAALRPVERMRRHAAAVTASQTGGRLPVPPANDEIGRLGRTLNEMLARLEVAFKRERAFVADASHELRTPLAILRTELELALRGEHTREELEAALRSAAEESERLSSLAEDLLVIARSDQGRLPVRPELLDAGAVLARVAGRFQTRAKAEGRPLEADPSPGVQLNADPARGRAGAGQPRRQRAALRRRDGRAERPRAQRQRRAARLRRGCRLSARVPPARVRALHPRRRGPLARGHWARPRDRRGDRRCSRRHRARAEPPARRGRLDRNPRMRDSLIFNSSSTERMLIHLL